MKNSLHNPIPKPEERLQGFVSEVLAPFSRFSSGGLIVQFVVFRLALHGFPS